MSNIFNANITANDTLLDHYIENESDHDIGQSYSPSCFLNAAANPLFALAGMLIDPETGDGIDPALTAAELNIPTKIMHAEKLTDVPIGEFEGYMGRVALAWLANHRANLLKQYVAVNPK